jgi:hypothetical protein
MGLMMKSGTDRIIDEKNKTIRVLTVIICLLLAAVIHAHTLVAKMPQDWTFWTPPNLDVGGKMKINTVPGVEAYNFAFTMWANVNTWLKDGAVEYSEKLDRYRLYLGSGFIASKKKEAQRDFQSNRNRTRTMAFEEGRFNATPLKGNRFDVSMDVRVVDKIGDITVIDEVRRYFFKVTPQNIPRQQNPWQLKIDEELKPYEVLKKYV